MGFFKCHPVPCSFLHPYVLYSFVPVFSRRAYINDNGQKAIAGIVHCAEKYRVCCSLHGSLGRTHAESVNNIRIILYWVGYFKTGANHRRLRRSALIARVRVVQMRGKSVSFGFADFMGEIFHIITPRVVQMAVKIPRHKLNMPKHPNLLSGPNTAHHARRHFCQTMNFLPEIPIV